MSIVNNQSAYPDAIVRSVEPEDYEAIRDIYAQPGAYWGTLQMPFPSKHLWRERLAQPAPGRHNLAACIEGTPVGNIGLMVSDRPRQRHIGDIGMGIRDDYAGKGIGELLMTSVLEIADNWLNLSRVELTVFVDNKRAVSLYERTGFEIEGQLRRYAFRDGEYADAYMMSRLK